MTPVGSRTGPATIRGPVLVGLVTLAVLTGLAIGVFSTWTLPLGSEALELGAGTVPPAPAGAPSRKQVKGATGHKDAALPSLSDQSAGNDDHSYAAMLVRGSIHMDPGVLAGREGFVMACGKVVPVASDLTFELGVPVAPCLFEVVVIAPDGRVAVGRGQVVAPTTAVMSGSPAVATSDLVGPGHEDFMEWAEHVTQAANSLRVMETVCASEAWARNPERCHRELLGPLLEHQAWIEEWDALLAPLASDSP